MRVLKNRAWSGTTDQKRQYSSTTATATTNHQINIHALQVQDFRWTVGATEVCTPREGRPGTQNDPMRRCRRAPCQASTIRARSGHIVEGTLAGIFCTVAQFLFDP